MPAPNATQIARWKVKYGDVYALQVGEATCYVRLPVPADITWAAKEGEAEPVECTVQLLLTCWLAGDDCIRQVDEYVLPAAVEFAELVAQHKKGAF